MNNFSDKKPAQFMAKYHHVSPHFVKSYTKKDGTFVSGFWRDGDGNTKIMNFRGYVASNPRHKK